MQQSKPNKPKHQKTITFTDEAFQKLDKIARRDERSLSYLMNKLVLDKRFK